MFSSTYDSLILTLAVRRNLHDSSVFPLAHSLTPGNYRTGMNYEMSRLIPPQFDTYGVTFWIPSQVEPTVALIGASMPALRHAFTTAVPQLSRIWTSIKSGSSQRTEDYGSLSAKSYPKSPGSHSKQTAYETDDTTRMLASQEPLEHPPRSYVQLQEWRQ